MPVLILLIPTVEQNINKLFSHPFQKGCRNCVIGLKISLALAQNRLTVSNLNLADVFSDVLVNRPVLSLNISLIIHWDFLM